MPRSVYHSHGARSEQLFHEDLVVESIRHYGQNFYYIPRTLVAKDEILGEDRLSEFKKAYSIEMYLENVDGFDGQGAFIQKFGLMMEQSATLVVARRRWEQLVGRFGATIIPSRPCEGDLLYFPLTDGLFEIKFVTHQDPFYQIGKLFVYKLQVELFQYASENIQTGVKDIDDFKTLKSFDINVVNNGVLKSIKLTDRGSGYTSAPSVILGTQWTESTNVATRDEFYYNGYRYSATKNGVTGTTPPTHTSGVVQNGSTEFLYVGELASATATLGSGPSAGQVVKITITDPGAGYTSPPEVSLVGGSGSGATAIAYIENLDNQDSFGDNNKFREEAIGIVFNEDNPFGEITPYPSPNPLYAVTSDSTSITSDSNNITADTQ